MPRGRDVWIVPEQLRLERKIGDLPDLCACLRQYLDAEQFVFEGYYCRSRYTAAVLRLSPVIGNAVVQAFVDHQLTI